MVGDVSLLWTLCRRRHNVHKIGNVLAALPKSVHTVAKQALAEIYNAEDREHAEKAAQAFANDYGVKWPKATAKIIDDLDVLLAFYDYPAEHWLRTELHTFKVVPRAWVPQMSWSTSPRKCVLSCWNARLTAEWACH
jgi:transposase-like protein